MRISVAKRLVMLGTVGVLFVALVAAIGFIGASRQSAHARAMARITDGMSRQWNADMMHDGIRGDVMAAMYATSDDQRTQYDTADVRTKAQDIVQNYDAAALTAPPAVAAQFATVRPGLLRYAGTALALVDLAASDKPAARDRLPGFLTLFGQLEQQLGGIDDAMLSAVDDTQQDARSAARQAKLLTLIAGLLALLAFSWFTFWVSRSVLLPMDAILQALRRVAGRDLTVRVGTDSGDEFAEMGTALNNALTEIGGVIRAAGRAAATLTTACTGLTSISGQLGQAAGATAEQAGQVSASADQVSANIGQMSNATDQMGYAISEIAGQTSAAASVAAEAVRATESTSRSMADLGQASEEIGEIVKAITTIAEQTNLLALNATIEAARAGEAGKGFAVVASEVKDLSQETGRATDDITRKIDSIQTMTAQARIAMEAICDVIARIDENQSMIAAAVEQQSATTAEISRGVLEIARGATHISGNISAISISTTTTSANARSTQESAAELSKLATEVTGQINRFSY